MHRPLRNLRCCLPPGGIVLLHDRGGQLNGIAKIGAQAVEPNLERWARRGGGGLRLGLYRASYPAPNAVLLHGHFSFFMVVGIESLSQSGFGYISD
jgi:hypothetical protein